MLVCDRCPMCVEMRGVQPSEDLTGSFPPHHEQGSFQPRLLPLPSLPPATSFGSGSPSPQIATVEGNPVPLRALHGIQGVHGKLIILTLKGGSRLPPLCRRLPPGLFPLALDPAGGQSHLYVMSFLTSCSRHPPPHPLPRLCWAPVSAGGLGPSTLVPRHANQPREKAHSNPVKQEGGLTLSLTPSDLRLSIPASF